MNIFLSEVENDNNIIETVFMSGNVFDNTVELFVPSTQEVMSGTFFFTDTLIFEQKLGGFASIYHFKKVNTSWCCIIPR